MADEFWLSGPSQVSVSARLSEGGPGECPASYEAVLEVVVAGDTGCLICGGEPEEHEPEKMSGLHKIESAVAALDQEE